MNGRKNNSIQTIRLGVFILIGIAIFMVGIFFIGKEKNLFNPTFQISGIFQNVSGLQMGSNIRFAGINVGTVGNIAIISDTSVRVDMLIKAEVRAFIKKDSRASIGSEGLMGDKIIHLTTGRLTDSVNLYDTIETISPIDLDEVLKDLKSTSQNAAIITRELAIILNSISSGKGTIGRLLMDTLLAESVNETIINAKKGTKEFNQSLEAAQDNFLLRRFFKKKENQKKKEK